MKNSSNLFFIGLMGAGKTSVGKQLAQWLNRTFLDSDHVIVERTGVSIPTIFELEGEQGFRQREQHIIDELTAQKGIILATGGGAILNPQNQSCLKNRGMVIYLHASPETLYQRTANDKNRPLLQVANPLKTLQDLYTARDPIYRECADMILDVENSTCLASAKKLFQLLEEKGIIECNL